MQRQRAVSLELAFPVLHVFRNIDDNRTGPAGACELKRAADRFFKLFRVCHEEHVLGDGAHDRGDRRLLERVRADRGTRHLSAYDDHGHRVRHAVAYRRDGIGRARAGRHHDDADLAAGACVPRGHETGALFVGRYDEPHRRLFVLRLMNAVVAKDGVVDGQDCATAVAEYRIDALIGEHLHHRICTGHALAAERMLVRPCRICLLVHRTVALEGISHGFLSSVY